MKKIFTIISVFCLIIPISSAAQVKGIKFEKWLSWKEIQDKARQENKYIFIDCYATWCSPCHYMTRNIFPLEAVGNYMNAHFISVKVQMDTTEYDNDDTQKWYADADVFRKKYLINVYPTYLYFNPKGELVEKAEGATDHYQKFIEKATAALRKADN